MFIVVYANALNILMIHVMFVRKKRDMKNWQKLKQELELYYGSKTHYAGDILRFCKLPIDKAICINSILYNLEIELTHDCDKIVLLKNNPVSIHVGKNLKTNQWRFAAAHSLGHLFLHESKEYSCNNMAHPNFLEKDANDFADNLLAQFYMV
mgnify:CR=1 FL=1